MASELGLSEKQKYKLDKQRCYWISRKSLSEPLTVLIRNLANSFGYIDPEYRLSVDYQKRSKVWRISLEINITPLKSNS